MNYGVLQPPGSPSERVSLMHYYNQDLEKEGSVKLKFGQHKDSGSSDTLLTSNGNTKEPEGSDTDKTTKTPDGAKKDKTAEIPGAQKTDGANDDKNTETPDTEKLSGNIPDLNPQDTTPVGSPPQSTTKGKRPLKSPDESEPPPAKKKKNDKLKEASSPASPR